MISRLKFDAPKKKKMLVMVTVLVVNLAIWQFVSETAKFMSQQKY